MKTLKEIKKIIGDNSFMIGFAYADLNTSIIEVKGKEYIVTNHVASKLRGISDHMDGNRFLRQLKELA